ncbi:cysteine desulfurase [Acuticoccus sp. MNP-M23]|uniref:cysteine desulfurase n=1 Tax=Acuticoccus sp. MNP-M23 TaxID=3072793 RepID=UPI002815C33D|nr:cysteine desulfurase [Acuticoccus sp. MNP-M23]WMS42310.1 cysteine desulfurase [Acuticoccus sp. MNP-M23]
MDAALRSFDIEKVRADFPIFKQEIHGKPLTYLDSAASSQKPQAVLDRIVKAYGEDYSNVHRGLHTLANRSTEAYEGAREIVRAHLNAPSAEEVIFTRSSTEAINLVAQAYLRPLIEPGDEIVLSVMEHHSNIVPWHQLREEKGAVLKWVELTEDGSLDMDGLEAALSERTRLVAVVHMSNVLGTVNPVAEIARLAHDKGAVVMVDGSQSAAHGRVDVQALDCDFFACTGHKIYGPSGIGALYGRRSLLEAMPPFMGGGEMIASVGRDTITYAGLPNRFEPGTPPIVQAIGLGAAIEYANGVGWDAIHAHEMDLRDYARERLRGINALTLYGDAPGKGAVFAFNLEGAHPHDVATILDREGVAVRAGSHCAEPLMTYFGVNASCRASFAMYNTRDDVDRLAAAIEKSHRFFA